MLTEQQANAIKEQLLKQLDHFPENKRDQIKDKILSMTLEEVEEFIKENQLTHMQKQKPEQEISECIFCNISSKKAPSFLIDEDLENLAVLELNPLSKGHCLIIPKKHLQTTEIPASSFRIAKKIAKKIDKKFKPKEIKISTQSILGHSLVELIPLYGDEKERKKATEEELEKLQKQLRFIKKVKKKKTIKKKDPEIKTKLPVLKPRIP